MNEVLGALLICATVMSLIFLPMWLTFPRMDGESPWGKMPHRYRILTRDNDTFKLQERMVLWPFWSDVSTRGSIASLEERIKEKERLRMWRTKVVARYK